MTKKICILFFFAAVCLLSNNSYSQANMAYLVADVETELMKTRLSLSAEQEKQVTEINRQYLENRNSISTLRGIPFTEFNEKMEKIENEKNLELRKVLSNEQWDIYSGKRNEDVKS